MAPFPGRRPRAVFLAMIGPAMTRLRCAILDDYFKLSLTSADWSKVTDRVDLTVFEKPFKSEAEAASALKDFEIILAMRERTAFPKSLFAALPKLKLMITSGMRNAAIDFEAAAAHDVVLCGTTFARDPTAPLAMGLILELTRNIGRESARMHAGAPWQAHLGIEIEGRTLGGIGLGKLGAKVAKLAQAFGMKVIAWSPNLTPEKCAEAGVDYAAKEDLLRNADIVTIHVQLADRSPGLLAEKALALMKPTAYLINTSRGPIVDEKALIAALTAGRLGGAGLDVFDVEPLPVDHPFRKLDNVVLTPHLGYVSIENYKVYYPDIVANIRAFVDGKPVKVITAR